MEDERVCERAALLYYRRNMGTVDKNEYYTGGNMSKGNRKTSKANKVLKAVGTAGIVFGAATIDANVVFAAELEEDVEASEVDSAAQELVEVGQRSETESASVIEGDAASEAQEQQVNVVGDVKSEADVAPTVMSDTPEMVEEDAPGDVESNSAGSSNENNGLESESVESGSENAGSESGAAESGSEDSGLESENVESGSEDADFESGAAESGSEDSGLA